MQHVSAAQVCKFLLRAGLIYAILMIPWPGLDDAYGAAFRQACNLAFQDWGRDGRAEFRAAGPVQPDPRMDTIVELSRVGRPERATRAVSSRFMAYMPTAALVSLVLATPVSWARRGRVAFWGLLLLHGAIAFRVGISILRDFCMAEQIAVYSLGPAWHPALEHLVTVFVYAPGSFFLIPVLIWLGLLGLSRDGAALVRAAP